MFSGTDKILTNLIYRMCYDLAKDIVMGDELPCMFACMRIDQTVADMHSQPGCVSSWKKPYRSKKDNSE